MPNIEIHKLWFSWKERLEICKPLFMSQNIYQRIRKLKNWTSANLFSFLFYYKCLITKWNFCQLVNNILVVFSLLVFYEIVMWNRDVVIIHQMELTAAMAVREQDPDSTADRSSESDSSDSEVVSFPVVVQSLPTNTTHFKKNTNKIPICTWWRANAPPLCLIF